MTRQVEVGAPLHVGLPANRSVTDLHSSSQHSANAKLDTFFRHGYAGSNHQFIQFDVKFLNYNLKFSQKMTW